MFHQPHISPIVMAPTASHRQGRFASSDDINRIKSLPNKNVKKCRKIFSLRDLQITVTSKKKPSNVDLGHKVNYYGDNCENCTGCATAATSGGGAVPRIVSTEDDSLASNFQCLNENKRELKKGVVTSSRCSGNDTVNARISRTSMIDFQPMRLSSARFEPTPSPTPTPTTTTYAFVSSKGLKAVSRVQLKFQKIERYLLSVRRTLSTTSAVSNCTLSSRSHLSSQNTCQPVSLPTSSRLQCKLRPRSDCTANGNALRSTRNISSDSSTVSALLFKW
ncbi:unnamed protein product [Soboliphyme baturini]|uniref:Uncharacterized protein n=1 Tax=Soboliphyme baturini TaxID=241478 RepID=A0A183IXE3_9BILA|nr:unnamed protein product [Soboliphyme baturini]